jgi:hypothetical protein
MLRFLGQLLTGSSAINGEEQFGTSKDRELVNLTGGQFISHPQPLDKAKM